MPSQMVTSVCLRSVWQDALVDYVSRMMDEFDIDGIYLDSTNMPFPCSNTLHGCEARRADGTKVPVYPVFAVRDTFRRLYAVVKGKKAEGIVDSHVFDCMNSAALAFATSYWNGEQLSAARFPSDALPLDRFRTEFMGVNWGVPCDLLAYQMGGFRNGLAVSLPHDVLVRCWQEELLVEPIALEADGRFWAERGAFHALFQPRVSAVGPAQGLDRLAVSASQPRCAGDPFEPQPAGRAGDAETRLEGARHRRARRRGGWSYSQRNALEERQSGNCLARRGLEIRLVPGGEIEGVPAKPSPLPPGEG